MDLAKLWCIGIKSVERTLRATTHDCIRTLGSLGRRLRTDHAHMRYKRLVTKNGQFYVDTLFSKVKSIRGFTCGNLFTNRLGFKKFFPMESESNSPSSLQSFIEIVGLPHALHADNAKTFKHGEFKKLCNKFRVKQTWTEPYSPWQNRAEGGIREVKYYARRLMEKTNAPIRLWCFAYEYAADILSLTATGTYHLGQRTPYEHVMQYTPDISEYVNFQWFQWSYYWDQELKEKRLCRWLGVAHNIGQSFCYWILLKNGSYIARSSVIPIPSEELGSTVLKEKMDLFTKELEGRIGNHDKHIVKDEKLQNDENLYDDVFHSDANDEKITYPWDSDLKDLPLYEENESTMKDLDEYIGTQITLMNEEGVPILAKVKNRKRDANGNLIGQRNDNPILDSRIFVVEFPDGRVDELSTNKIAESLYSDIDEEGHNTGIMQEIVDHRCTKEAVSKENGYVISANGNKTPVITTKGWDIRIRWSDNSYDWIPLYQVKDANPIKLAEYAISHGIQNEPAFNWWVRQILRKRDRIISKMKSRRLRKPRMKFGIKIPRNVKEALQFDKDNQNTFWEDAINKERENVKIAFKRVPDGEKVPPGYTEIHCFMNFEVKFDLRRKARYVASGNMTDPLPSMSYSSVVSRESVRIAFLIAALNDLKILAGDIQNAYLNAETKERVWFEAGPEFGDHGGKPILIVRALYGLRGSGKAWRYNLADKLRNELNFRSSLADPDVWRKPNVKANGKKYYSYILVYVDDILIVDEDPTRYMEKLKDLYTVKKDSIHEPDIYLGANVQKVDTRCGQHKCWGISCEQYVRDSIKNVKARLLESQLEFNKKLSSMEYSPQNPFSNVKYRPELEVSRLCRDEEVNFYQNLIGILRWTVELGRIDIHHEVALLSQYLATPRVGHLEQALHIFKYLDVHKSNFISFDPTRLELEESNNLNETSNFKMKEMKEFYPDAEEDLPMNAPEPRGEAVQFNVFVDSDHAGNLVTRRSHTGILVFLNMAPIYWYSKRQNTVESSTFSSEFVALKTAVEIIISLRYKLRMMGVPIDDASRIFCDNEAVFKNSSIASSTLKRKHNSIAYHRVRESVAAGIVEIHKEDGNSNLADILTKPLNAVKRKYLRERIMVDVKINCKT